MANSKRASMREGPLAALFRRTEEEEREPGQEAPAKAPAAQEPIRASTASAPAREAPPHPSLAAAAPQTAAARAAASVAVEHAPSPQERLRHAFSSEQQAAADSAS